MFDSEDGDSRFTLFRIFGERCQITRRHIPENIVDQSYHRDNLRSILKVLFSLLHNTDLSPPPTEHVELFILPFNEKFGFLYSTAILVGLTLTETFLFRTASISAVGPTLSPLQWVPG
jgi:hypothetical protein